MISYDNEGNRVILIPEYMRAVVNKLLAWVLFLYAIAFVGVFFFLFITKIIIAFAEVFFDEKYYDFVFWGVLSSTWVMICVAFAYYVSEKRN